MEKGNFFLKYGKKIWCPLALPQQREHICPMAPDAVERTDGTCGRGNRERQRLTALTRRRGQEDGARQPVAPESQRAPAPQTDALKLGNEALSDKLRCFSRVGSELCPPVGWVCAQPFKNLPHFATTREVHGNEPHWSSKLDGLGTHLSRFLSQMLGCPMWGADPLCLRQKCGFSDSSWLWVVLQSGVYGKVWLSLSWWGYPPVCLMWRSHPTGF